jgi:hypothetical protein
VREGLDRRVVQIREAVFDLHPYLLEQAGLGAALRAVAERAARQARFTAVVDVEPAAEGAQDQLLFSVGRELIANAAKHSAAARLDVVVRREGDRILLEVVDDGPRDPARRAAPGAADRAHRPRLVRRARRGGRRLAARRARPRRPRHAGARRGARGRRGARARPRRRLGPPRRRSHDHRSAARPRRRRGRSRPAGAPAGAGR